MNSRFYDLVVTHWGARFMGHNLPVAIGRSGIAEKIGEGDGITPVSYTHLRAHETRGKAKTALSN